MSTLRVPAFAVLVAALSFVGLTGLTRTNDGVALAQGLRDRTVAPVFEGFQRIPDGTFDLLFGYFNRNWDEEIDAPLGPANHIEPGGPDQGQPTHLLPRRNRFVFRIRVPANFGNGELVWTLVTKGETLHAYGTLRPLYEVDDIAIAANFGAGGQTGNRPDIPGNKPPNLEVEGEKNRSVRVGATITLNAVATDDGLPHPRPMDGFVGQDRTVPRSATGLRLSWFVYRGTGDVTFDPPQAKVWEDLRDGGNSPWSVGWKTPSLPTDNRWVTRVTFKKPGTYVLRCQAHDGATFAFQDVTFVVN
jgi:hypothetical protein